MPNKKEVQPFPGIDKLAAVVLGMVWGKMVDVVYNDGFGGTKTRKGTVKSLDQDGFVVIEDVEGKVIAIPKDKVIDITEV